MHPYFQPNKNFCAGSTEHIIAVLLVVCLGIIATRWAKKSTPEREANQPIAQLFIYQVFHIYFDLWKPP
jgi:hypothetical protein